MQMRTHRVAELLEPEVKVSQVAGDIAVPDCPLRVLVGPELNGLRRVVVREREEEVRRGAWGKEGLALVV